MDKSQQDFIDHQLKWHNRNPHGCLFATRMSKSPDQYDWLIICLLEDSIPDICREVDRIILESINNSNIQALSIIIPNLDTNQKLESFIIEVKSLPNWYIVENILEKTGERLVGVNYMLPETNENNENRILWILGFGPFDSFAKTRISPYTELAMTVKSKQFFKQKHSRYSYSQHNIDSVDRDPKSKATDEAHLADIHLEGITNDTPKDENFWRNTQLRKRRILDLSLDTDSSIQSSDTLKTKARITFVLPKNNEN